MPNTSAVTLISAFNAELWPPKGPEAPVDVTGDEDDDLDDNDD